MPFGSRRTCAEQLKSACTSVPRLLPSRPAAPARLATKSDTSLVANASSHQAHMALALRVRCGGAQEEADGFVVDGDHGIRPLGVAAVDPAEEVELLPAVAERLEVGGRVACLASRREALTKEARISFSVNGFTVSTCQSGRTG